MSADQKLSLFTLLGILLLILVVGFFWRCTHQ